MFKSLFLSVLFALLVMGCIQREPGPAELIGKGIDQMAEGMKGLSKDENYGGSADQDRARSGSDERDFNYDDRSRDYPDHDPYYDPNDPYEQERLRRQRDRKEQGRF